MLISFPFFAQGRLGLLTASFTLFATPCWSAYVCYHRGGRPEEESGIPCQSSSSSPSAWIRVERIQHQEVYWKFMSKAVPSTAHVSTHTAHVTSLPRSRCAPG